MKTWNYKVPAESCQGWGKFSLDSSGYFSAVSDYGNYAFQWTSFGEGVDFREFLSSLDADYLMGKLGRRDWYDGDATVLAIRKRVLELRRDRSITKDVAADVWAAIEDDLEGNPDSPESAHNFIGKFDCMADEWEICRYDFPPDLKAFAEKLMPRLHVLLKADMAKAGTIQVWLVRVNLKTRDAYQEKLFSFDS